MFVRKISLNKYMCSMPSFILDNKRKCCLFPSQFIMYYNSIKIKPCTLIFILLNLLIFFSPISPRPFPLRVTPGVPDPDQVDFPTSVVFHLVEKTKQLVNVSFCLTALLSFIYSSVLFLMKYSYCRVTLTLAYSWLIILKMMSVFIYFFKFLFIYLFIYLCCFCSFFYNTAVLVFQFVVAKVILVPCSIN